MSLLELWKSKEKKTFRNCRHVRINTNEQASENIMKNMANRTEIITKTKLKRSGLKINKGL